VVVGFFRAIFGGGPNILLLRNTFANV